jgi:leader peptidase (prepilin peptidase)/N-methyltransferase
MNNLVFTFLAFIFGACIGSFLNVVILRLPRGQKLTGRSHCNSCGRILRAGELVPVFSYLVLRGRCRGCGVKISPRYLIIEIISGLLFAWAAWFFYPGSFYQAAVLAKILAVISVLTAVFVIDLEHYLILDSVLAVGAGAMLLCNFVIDAASRMPVWSWHGNFVLGILSALFCPLPFFLLWYFSGGKWMGFGDVKLAIFLGLALPWPLWPVALMLSVFLGGGVGLVLLASGTKGLKSRLPFGTFLSVGAVLSIFYGQAILRWYLSVLGF